MWITVGSVQSKLTRATDKERAWVQEYLTFEGKRRGRNEGESVCLMNLFALTFPSGFNSMIKKAAIEDGLSVEFVDNRVRPCEVDPLADLEWLRDYQQKAVAVAARRGRGILWLPTGAGKTEIIVGISRALPCKWLALVHRSQLADDIAARYEKRSIGLVAGRILEGTWDVPDDAMLVSATYQSMRAALESGDARKKERAEELLRGSQGLFVDEVHTAPAETYMALLMKTKNAYFRFGLSGTPLARSDAKSQYAIAAIGPVIYQIKPQLLIDRGVLAKPTVRMADVFQQASGAKSWPTVYRELIVRSKKRNERVIKYAAKATKPAFVFVEQTEHGRQLVKDLFRAGMKAEFVWGTHSIDYRKSLIRRLVLGHFDVLVCSRVFNEGIDVPELRSVVNAGGMKSIIATLQRLGRGMRVDKDTAGNVREGGDVFEVYDIMDTGQKWLEEHAGIRQSAYSNDGYELFIDPQDRIADMKASRKKSAESEA